MNHDARCSSRRKKRVLILVLGAIACWMAACGAHSSSTTIWAIAVNPNQATATSGSAPANEVDFSVTAHYTDGHSAPWTGAVQWSVDAGWVSLLDGKAICLHPAPLGIFNLPTPANIAARVVTGGTTLTGPAALACL